MRLHGRRIVAVAVYLDNDGFTEALEYPSLGHGLKDGTGGKRSERAGKISHRQHFC
jgi:hypothetical protein